MAILVAGLNPDRILDGTNHASETGHLKMTRLLFSILFTIMSSQIANSTDTNHVSVRRDVVYAIKEGYWCESSLKESDWLGQIGMMSKTHCKRKLELKMDIYAPVSGNSVLKPAVLLLHGGSFYMNSKSFEPMPSLCRELAAHGYVAVSMDYRMGFRPNRKAILQAQYDASEDAADALDFLVTHAEEYGIDPSRIALGGSSSGAITSLLTAFSDRGRSVKAVINMWGAVYDLEAMDAYDTPVISFHGDKDTTVPYAEGVPMGMSLFMDKMYGSKCITERRSSQGKDARLITFESYRHAPQRNKDLSFNANWPVIRDGIREFLDEVL